MVRLRRSVGDRDMGPCDCCLSAGGAVGFIPEEADNETPSSHSRSHGGGGENRNILTARRFHCSSGGGQGENKILHSTHSVTPTRPATPAHLRKKIRRLLSFQRLWLMF